MLHLLCVFRSSSWSLRGSWRFLRGVLVVFEMVDASKIHPGSYISIFKFLPSWMVQEGQGWSGRLWMGLTDWVSYWVTDIAKSRDAYASKNGELLLIPQEILSILWFYIHLSWGGGNGGGVSWLLELPISALTWLLIKMLYVWLELLIQIEEMPPYWIYNLHWKWRAAPHFCFVLFYMFWLELWIQNEEMARFSPAPPPLLNF